MDSETADGGDVEVLPLTKDEYSILLCKDCLLAEQVAQVSGASLSCPKQGKEGVEIFGSRTVRQRARKYVEVVLRQRLGRVMAISDDDDVTVLD